MEDGVENDTESDPKKSVNLLYPELMTTTELISVLEQRYIQNEDLKSLSKEGLVELYYSYVLPLPQRKYRMNRRGREMTKKQIIMAKKRKIESDNSDSSEPPQKKTGLVSSFNISTGERIKPPPSCIDFSRKKISLSSKTKPNESSSSQSQRTDSDGDNKESKDTHTLRKKIVKISLDSGSSESSAEVNNVLTKKIKLNSGQKSPSDLLKKVKLSSPTSPNKTQNFQSTVSLINKHIGGKDGHCGNNKTEKTDNDISKVESSEDETPKKKSKISKISWP